MSLDRFLVELDAKARQVGLYTANDSIPGETANISELRRYRSRREVDDVQIVTLAAGKRGLRWIPGPWMPKLRRAVDSVSVIRQYRFVRDKPSGLRRDLHEIDLRINDTLRGIGQRRTTLLRWRGAGRNPTKMARPNLDGRILLVIHAQWSSGTRLYRNLWSSESGKELIRDLSNRYKYIVSFEHPTISVTPSLNAADLQIEIDRSFAAQRVHEVDVLSHGRGGLVSRYLFEVLNPALQPRRHICVGTPLSGSGESYKSRLLDTLSYLTNIAYEFGEFGQIMSILDVVPKILSIYTTIKEQYVDQDEVGVATSLLIPGLRGIDENSDEMNLLRLMTKHNNGNALFSIGADFRPETTRWPFLSELGKPFDPDSPQTGGDLLTPMHRMRDLFGRESLPDDRLFVLRQSAGTNCASYFVDAEVNAQLRTWLLDGG